MNVNKRTFQMVFRKGKDTVITPGLTKGEVRKAIHEYGLTGLIEIRQDGRPLSCQEVIVIFRALGVLRTMDDPDSN